MKKWILLLPILTSCSVMMASDCGGVNPESIELMASRDQLIEIGARPLYSETNEDGRITETFLIPRAHGSLSRAIIHGSLDLITGFLWELAATPIESSIDKKDPYCAKITFDPEMQIVGSTLL
jgi:hypothetical protein